MTGCPKCGFHADAPVTASWSFDIPRTVESGNARVVNSKARGWAYKAKREKWERDMLACRRVYGVTLAVGKRRVTLTRLMGKGEREYDRDNLAAGLKSCVDAMTKAGLIVGDGPKQVEIHYAQERAAVAGLRVLVEELG